MAHVMAVMAASHDPGSYQAPLTDAMTFVTGDE
jgi:hypothetical protein